MVNSARGWTVAELDGVNVGDTVRVFASSYSSTSNDVAVSRVTPGFIETVDGRRWLRGTGAVSPKSKSGVHARPSATVCNARAAARSARAVDDEVIRKATAYGQLNEWHDDDIAELARVIRSVERKNNERTDAAESRQKRKRT